MERRVGGGCAVAVHQHCNRIEAAPRYRIRLLFAFAFLSLGRLRMRSPSVSRQSRERNLRRLVRLVLFACALGFAGRRWLNRRGLPVANDQFRRRAGGRTAGFGGGRRRGTRAPVPTAKSEASLGVDCAGALPWSAITWTPSCGAGTQSASCCSLKGSRSPDSEHGSGNRRYEPGLRFAAGAWQRIGDELANLGPNPSLQAARCRDAPSRGRLKTVSERRCHCAPTSKRDGPMTVQRCGASI
jgi:hypothetical protein